MSNSASWIRVRLIEHADQMAFLKQARLSHGLHRQWIDVPIGHRAFKTYVEELSTENNRGFLICRSETQALVGVIELRDIYYQNFRNNYAVCDGVRQEGEGPRLLNVVSGGATSNVEPC